MLFFFFQAEDGIRDRDVTGVQTCALPIFGPIVADNRGAYLEIEGHTDSTGPVSYNRRLGEDRALAVRDYLHDHYQIALNRKIGRASCRERVEIAGDGVSVKKKKVIVVTMR